jgi:hypothetical protein
MHGLRDPGKFRIIGSWIRALHSHSYFESMVSTDCPPHQQVGHSEFPEGFHLQQCCVLFAANFICWATQWLAQQEVSVENA